MGKFKLEVRKKGQSETWLEEYDKPSVKNKVQAEVWGKDLIDKYNQEEQWYFEAGRIPKAQERVFVAVHWL